MVQADSAPVEPAAGDDGADDATAAAGPSIDAYIEQVAKLEAEMEEKNLLIQNQTATIEDLEESRSSVQLQLDDLQTSLRLCARVLSPRGVCQPAVASFRIASFGRR